MKTYFLIFLNLLFVHQVLLAQIEKIPTKPSSGIEVKKNATDNVVDCDTIMSVNTKSEIRNFSGPSTSKDIVKVTKGIKLETCDGIATHYLWKELDFVIKEQRTPKAYVYMKKYNTSSTISGLSVLAGLGGVIGVLVVSNGETSSRPFFIFMGASISSAIIFGVRKRKSRTKMMMHYNQEINQ
jgi:hypothetical protein